MSVYRKLFICLCLFVLLSACEKLAITAEKDSSEKKSVGANETVTVLMPTLTSFKNQDEMGAALDRAKAEFEAKYAGSQLVYKFVPGKTYTQSLKQMIAEGNPPDIFGESSNYLQHDVDYALDLTPFFKTDNLNIAKIYPQNIIDLLTLNKKLIGIPFQVDPVAVGYNKSWFNQAGIPYPDNDWTWEDFLNIASKLKEANGGRSSINFLFNYAYLELLTLSKGGRFLSEDGQTTEGYLNSAKSVEAFQWAADLYNVHKVTDMDTVKKNVSLLASNEIGMVIRPVSTLEGLYYKNKKDIGVANLPYFNNGIRVNAGVFSGYGIFQSSKNPKAAWNFLKIFAIDVNDVTLKMYDLRYAFSLPLAESRRNSNDPFNQVRVEGVSHFTKVAVLSNEWFPQAVAKEKQNIQNLLEPGTNMKEELTTISKEIDQQIVDLENK